MKLTRSALPALVAFLSLTGCDSTKEMLGLKEKQPDAFEVMDRAPLELPPNFTLLPPEPGKKRPQEQPKKALAEQRLLAQSKSKNTHKNKGHYKSSHGQKLLLKKAGADTKTNHRASMRAEESKASSDSFLKQLVATSHKPAVIDPVAEKKRLSPHPA